MHSFVLLLKFCLFPAVGTCAHVTALVRTKHGPFTLKDCLHSENYNVTNVIRAIREAQKNHPQLVDKLNDYFENLQIKEAEVKEKKTLLKSGRRKIVKPEMDVEILDYDTLKRQGYT